MYLLEETFEMISKRLGLTLEEEQRAFSIHEHILKCIRREYRDKSYFRYNENSKNIALNITNYKIYEYPYKIKEIDMD